MNILKVIQENWITVAFLLLFISAIFIEPKLSKKEENKFKMKNHERR